MNIVKRRSCFQGTDGKNGDTSSYSSIVSWGSIWDQNFLKKFKLKSNYMNSR